MYQVVNRHLRIAACLPACDVDIQGLFEDLSYCFSLNGRTCLDERSDGVQLGVLFVIDRDAKPVLWNDAHNYMRDDL
jgi:hypothetical protein